MNSNLSLGLVWLATVLGAFLVGNGLRDTQPNAQDSGSPDAKAGLDAFEKGDYKTAVKELKIAAGAVGRKDLKARKLQAQYCYDLGRVHLDWLKKDKTLSEAARHFVSKPVLKTGQSVFRT